MFGHKPKKIYFLQFGKLLLNELNTFSVQHKKHRKYLSDTLYTCIVKLYYLVFSNISLKYDIHLLSKGIYINGKTENYIFYSKV